MGIGTITTTGVVGIIIIGVGTTAGIAKRLPKNVKTREPKRKFRLFFILKLGGTPYGASSTGVLDGPRPAAHSIA
jgi:hypothetical protein